MSPATHTHAASLASALPGAAFAAAMAGQAQIPISIATPLINRAVALVAEAHDLVRTYRERIAELEKLSTTDPLTGLFNRRGFEAQFAHHLASARRQGQTGVVALIDLDNFKAINDAHGHNAGDAALRHFGGMLREALRESDIVARFGGDEFAVLLTNCQAEGADLRLRSVAAEIAETEAQWQDCRFRICASIGTASYGAADTSEDLLHRADLALYADKRFKEVRAARA